MRDTADAPHTRDTRGTWVTTLWQLALSRPQLLTAHLAGYAQLALDETALSAALVRRRALLGVVAAVALLLAAVHLGVALMLWATAAPGTLAQPWVLVVVPLVPLLCGVWAWLALRRSASLPLWAALRTQAGADVAVLRAAAQAAP